MSTSQIPCPGCQKALLVANFTQPKRLRCPWCRTEFTASPSAAVPAAPTRPSLAPVTPVRRPVNPVETPPGNTRWAVAILGGLVLVLASAAAAAWYFSGGGDQPEQSSGEPAPPTFEARPGTRARPACPHPSPIQR